MNPYDPTEIGRHDPELDRVARELEEQAEATGGDPPAGLAGRIMATIDDEPIPASRWAWLATLPGPARVLAAAAVVVVAVTGALAIGSLLEEARPDVGNPPTPALLPSPSATASPSPSPSVSPSPSPSPTSSPTPSPTIAVVPSPSDDDDDLATPEPSDSDDDNSGPGGGGGDDDSGSGDDDSSGSGD